MATRKASPKKALSAKPKAAKQVAKQDNGDPKFPYTTEPKALARLLVEIPKKPKPPKVTLDTLKSWSVSKNSNARTAINVLKKLGLLGGAGEPTDKYLEFMKTGTGPRVLGVRLREVYKVLFENSLAPQTESNDELKKLFHIHSGGGAELMRLQVQTFKVLADHASFEGSEEQPSNAINGQGQGGSSGHKPGSSNGQALPPVNIDLHIHLPENKTSRDYEAIIQDIARYIYGRSIDAN